MVKTVSFKTDVPANHEVRVTLPDDVPVGPAEFVLIVVSKGTAATHTLGELGDSEFFGMWKDRTDIEDSADFARHLREEGWKRSA